MTTDTTTVTIKPKEPLRYRHELKYILNSGEDRILSSRLGNLFSHDAYAGADGCYRITSLYFDTPGDTALRQKVDGLNRREKFRIRYYGTDTGYLKLEKKMKINGLCAKQSTRLSKAQAQQILAGEIGFLRDSGDALMTELYSKMVGKNLRPRTIVVYDREAFTYAPGNVRLTLDRRVRTSIRATDFLDAQRVHLDVADGMTVLEVKYDAFLPEIVRMAVRTGNVQVTAFSKYAVSRKYE